ncbi:MAG: hypothetical protein J7K87_02795 [Candidatus Aenigmarchaeota archaeon]|nr:hypothetical protein [Candidatus Aenigmarchaeota archaeon]
MAFFMSRDGRSLRKGCKAFDKKYNFLCPEEKSYEKCVLHYEECPKRRIVEKYKL